MSECLTRRVNTTGRGCYFSRFRYPNTLLAWDDDTAHKTVARKEARVKLNIGTTLLNLPGGLTPKITLRRNRHQAIQVEHGGGL